MFLKGVIGMSDNNDTMCGINDEELTRLFRESVRIEKEVSQIRGLPVAEYNPETKETYLKYPDGRKEYVK